MASDAATSDTTQHGWMSALVCIGCASLLLNFAQAGFCFIDRKANAREREALRRDVDTIKARQAQECNR